MYLRAPRDRSRGRARASGPRRARYARGGSISKTIKSWRRARTLSGRSSAKRPLSSRPKGARHRRQGRAVGDQRDHRRLVGGRRHAMSQVGLGLRVRTREFPAANAARVPAPCADESALGAIRKEQTDFVVVAQGRNAKSGGLCCEQALEARARTKRKRLRECELRSTTTRTSRRFAR